MGETENVFVDKSKSNRSKTIQFKVNKLLVMIAFFTTVGSISVATKVP